MKKKEYGKSAVSDKPVQKRTAGFYIKAVKNFFKKPRNIVLAVLHVPLGAIAVFSGLMLFYCSEVFSPFAPRAEAAADFNEHYAIVYDVMASYKLYTYIIFGAAAVLTVFAIAIYGLRITGRPRKIWLGAVILYLAAGMVSFPKYLYERNLIEAFEYGNFALILLAFVCLLFLLLPAGLYIIYSLLASQKEKSPR